MKIETPFTRLNVVQQDLARRAARRQTTTVHDESANLIREMGAHESHIAAMSDDKTLYVYGTPPDMRVGDVEQWPCARGACFFVASYAVKAATERGCGKIVVHRGHGHKHEFDTAEVVKACKRRARGVLKKPVVNHKNIGQMIHIANKSVFDVTRPTWSVPITLSGNAGSVRADTVSTGGIYNGK